MRVAIYEPSPRICGPATWCTAMRHGMRALGHECDVVAFNKSGKAQVKWGRVHREKSASQSCSLEPDIVCKINDAGWLLNQYDFVVLSDVKTPAHDKPAYDDFDMPEYIKILSSTNTKWTSALHGRWYYGEHEVPKGLSVLSGSPFIEELLALPNFCGGLLAHANDFDRYCAALQPLPKQLVNLPFITSDSFTFGARTKLAANGRMVPTKHRHVIQRALALVNEPLYMRYSGTVSVTHGPSCSHTTWEDATEKCGYESVLKNEGVSGAWGWLCRHPRNGVTLEYYGAYEKPIEVLQDVITHVAITDADFSGGLLEFSTLEAIDCGCAPIITEPFIPDAGHDAALFSLPFEFVNTSSPKMFDEHPLREPMLKALIELIYVTMDNWNETRALYNRDALRRCNDPATIARIACEMR